MPKWCLHNVNHWTTLTFLILNKLSKNKMIKKKCFVFQMHYFLVLFFRYLSCNHCIPLHRATETVQRSYSLSIDMERSTLFREYEHCGLLMNFLSTLYKQCATRTHFSYLFLQMYKKKYVHFC